MAVYNSKNKWNSQHIQKQFKNNHHDGLYAGWRKYSNSNHSNSFTKLCNEYQKDHYFSFNNNETEIIDEYELSVYEPQYWKCNKCTFDNCERDLYCSICKSPFISSNRNINTSQNTLSDYLPSEVNDIIHCDDDIDESIQVAIILSLTEHKNDINQSIHSNQYNETTFDFNHKSTTKTPSKPTLNGYKSNKTQNKKYCSTTDNNDNEIQIKTQKEWCIHKNYIAKQKRKQRYHNKKENKRLRRNHLKCIKTCPKLKNLVNKTKINHIKKEIKQSYAENKKFNLQCILNYKIVCKFMSSGGCSRGRGGDDGQLKIVYHGTNHRNNQSIIEKGLIVGGTKGIGIRCGRVYGKGVYCSPYTSTASGYEDGSMFICIVKNKRVNHFGSIWVVPNDTDILPLFLASFDKQNRIKDVPRVNKNNSNSNDGLSQQIIKFIPSFHELNEKNSMNRKIKRKWNAFFKINHCYD